MSLAYFQHILAGQTVKINEQVTFIIKHNVNLSLI